MVSSEVKLTFSRELTGESFHPRALQEMWQKFHFYLNIRNEINWIKEKWLCWKLPVPEQKPSEVESSVSLSRGLPPAPEPEQKPKHQKNPRKITFWDRKRPWSRSVIWLGAGEGFGFEWNTTACILNKSGLSVPQCRGPNVTNTIWGTYCSLALKNVVLVFLCEVFSYKCSNT